jgi:hypothetical protein
MTSEVEICNIALSNIRASSINSLNESSIQAEICKLKYPVLRDRCLRDGPWLFNRKIQALATVTTEVFNWAYSYSYPADCLKIRRMIGAYEELPSGSANVASRLLDSRVLPNKGYRRQIPYEVFNFDNERVIGSDQPDLRIDFAAKIVDPNLFSDDFIMALSYLLSAELAIPIVGAELGRSLRSESFQLYTNYLSSAMALDQNDQYLQPKESDYILVRN